jgi:hypothetical protein
MTLRFVIIADRRNQNEDDVFVWFARLALKPHKWRKNQHFHDEADAIAVFYTLPMRFCVCYRRKEYHLEFLFGLFYGGNFLVWEKMCYIFTALPRSDGFSQSFGGRKMGESWLGSDL